MEEKLAKTTKDEMEEKVWAAAAVNSGFGGGVMEEMPALGAKTVNEAMEEKEEKRAKTSFSDSPGVAAVSACGRHYC